MRLSLICILVGGAYARTLRGLATTTTNEDAPTYPVVIESLGETDPLLADLVIPQDATETGAWSSLQTWPLIAIHAAILPDGKLVTYGGKPNAAVQDGRTYTFWDPTLGFIAEALNTVPNAQRVDSFCSSGVLLNDGTFLVAGGKGYTSSRSVESSLLNYKTQVATRAGNMFAPHWYGTMTKLPDGRALMTGGGVAYAIGRYNPDYTRDKISPTPEVFSVESGWSRLNGASSREAFGADANRYWYPHQWVTARGTVFGISTDRMWEMNLEGGGSTTILGTSFKVPPDSESAARPNVGASSSAVMYDTGKIIQMGGNGFANGYPSDSSTEASIFDITDIANGVKVTETSSMAIPRQWHNSMVLPDGKVVVTGGTKYALTDGDNAVYDAEIWDPKTGKWKLAAKAAVFRAYHAVALMLPNGAIYTGGSGVPGPVQNFNAEIFFPPYFFQKLSDGSTVLRSRPKIVSMSTNSLNYRDLLQIQVAGGATITEVSLIALPVITHSFDSNQRRMTLAFSQSSQNGDISVTLPKSANLAPPGHYYLNLVGKSGIPSEAAIISLSAAAPPVLGQTCTFQPITGAFTMEANARFDVLSGRPWQRIIDFSNGIRSDNIILGQIKDSTGIFLSIYRGDVGMHLQVENVLVKGEMAHWKAGADDSGLMWIEKNGNRVGSKQGHVPKNVFRTMQNVGMSSWPNDATLRGLVSGLKITNKQGYDDGGQFNVPKQITGAFSVSVIVVFHEVSQGRAWQRVFDFGNGQGLDNIVLSQHAQWKNMMLEIWRDGKRYRLIAQRSIVEGELATWRAGVDNTGLMWIEKNGERLASMPGVLPRNTLRRNMLIGESHWAGNAQLVGAVLGLEVVNEAETGVPEQITGAFVSEVAARFDNLSRSWQRVFDFGNGPKQDNIVLSQYARTNDMAVEIWRDGVNHQLVAPNAIVEGELATWKVGVDSTGWTWLEKNGLRLTASQGIVPRDVYRANMLFGESNWDSNDDHAGVILGHDVKNADGDANDGGLMNFPEQIDGEFSVMATARFDNLNLGWQRIFDFGSPADTTRRLAFGNISFGQFEGTDDVILEIWSLYGVPSRLRASHAIMKGEVALWQVGVDRTGLMWIAKNGNRLTEGPGILPASIFRQKLLIGESNWDHPKLDGVILGLRVSTDGQGGQFSIDN